MTNFPKGAEGLIIVGKTTSSRKLGGGIDKGIGLGGDGPSPTLSYLQGRSDRGCVGVAPPTFGTSENSGKIESLHRQNQVVFEELRTTYCLYTEMGKII